MKPISGAIYEMLVRQGIAAGRVGARTGRGKTASSRAALSFMSRANAILDREGAVDLHSPTVGEENTRPIRISGKRGASRNRRQSDLEVKNEGKATLPGDPSPANRPVLRIVVDNGRCLGTANPTRLPRAAVSKHLQLVK